MSRIFKEWHCDHCGASFQYYVSFGHPDEDFVFKWKCNKCDGVNELRVKAMPHDKSFYLYNPPSNGSAPNFLWGLLVGIGVIAAIVLCLLALVALGLN